MKGKVKTVRKKVLDEYKKNNPNDFRDDNSILVSIGLSCLVFAKETENIEISDVWKDYKFCGNTQD